MSSQFVICFWTTKKRLVQRWRKAHARLHSTGIKDRVVSGEKGHQGLTGRGRLLKTSGVQTPIRFCCDFLRLTSIYLQKIGVFNSCKLSWEILYYEILQVTMETRKKWVKWMYASHCEVSPTLLRAIMCENTSLLNWSNWSGVVRLLTSHSVLGG